MTSDFDAHISGLSSTFNRGLSWYEMVTVRQISMVSEKFMNMSGGGVTVRPFLDKKNYFLYFCDVLSSSPFDEITR
jgi:hypothetical protein